MIRLNHHTKKDFSIISILDNKVSYFYIIPFSPYALLCISSNRIFNLFFETLTNSIILNREIKVGNGTYFPIIDFLDGKGFFYDEPINILLTL